MAKNACEVGSAYNMDIYILYLCLCHLKHIDALATLIWYLVSPTLIVNHGVVSPTLKVNLTFLVIPCIFLGGLYICNLAINVTYQVICHPISNHPWQYFITSCWQENVGFGQWTNSVAIHDNIYSLIHKKCHIKSSHSDIKYHMTLNIIFSIVTPNT
jgi:hypothetical protein